MCKVLPYILVLALLSCQQKPAPDASRTPPPVAMDSGPIKQDTPIRDTGSGIKTGNTEPNQLISFSQTLKGVPYKYGSSHPATGFDCSGFITYVFNHFGIEVPRSSVEFTDEGVPVALASAKPGDLILFTGTDNTIRTVGHMGIVTQAGDSTVFIHSSSGKANGVTETKLNEYYMGRFMKVIRVFRK